MLKVKIDNMHCQSCLRNIEDALTEIDPKVQLKANFTDKLLEIHSELEQQRVLSKLAEEGYPANLVLEQKS
jgi:copper chaperone CopZ